MRDADSGWRKVGRTRESGWSFEVAGEGTQILRGVVGYRWTRNKKVVRRARRVTEGGHHSTVGADPAGLQRRDLPNRLTKAAGRW